MGLDELQNWIAVDMLTDDKYRKKIELSIQKNQSLEDEASQIRLLLSSLGSVD